MFWWYLPVTHASNYNKHAPSGCSALKELGAVDIVRAYHESQRYELEVLESYVVPVIKERESQLSRF